MVDPPLSKRRDSAAAKSGVQVTPSGQIPFTVGCNGMTGAFAVQVALVDAQGNENNAGQFSSECIGEQICGNGVREATERCDGAALGGQTCPPDYTTGMVTCTEGCTIDMSGCGM